MGVPSIFYFFSRSVCLLMTGLPGFILFMVLAKHIIGIQLLNIELKLFICCQPDFKII